MDPIIVGIILLGVLFVFLFSGTPITFGLGIPAVLILFLYGDWGQLDLLGSIVFEGVNDFGLLTIPLFILMGSIVAVTPTGSDLYEGINRWVHKLPGGLAISNVISCGIFSALCGSSAATAAAIGTMGIPEMRKRGYPEALATGAIVGGGALGNLIPPGLVQIVYGISTQTSIGKLFVGSVIPGIIVLGMMCLWVAYYSRRLRKTRAGKINPQSKESASEFYGDVFYTWKDRFEGLLKVIPFLILIVLLLFVLYGGYATPSEAAGVSAVMTLIMAIVIYRLKSFRVYQNILEMTIRETTMVMMIMATAYLFAVVLAKLYVTQAFTTALVGLGLSNWGMMFLITIFLLILGCFLPPVAIVLITCPILYPVIRSYGFDPIWFGVIVTINMEVGMITPPFGGNLFVVKGIAPDIPLSKILIGSAPFAVCLLLGILICSLWPELILWLPNKMMATR